MISTGVKQQQPNSNAHQLRVCISLPRDKGCADGNVSGCPRRVNSEERIQSSQRYWEKGSGRFLPLLFWQAIWQAFLRTYLGVGAPFRSEKRGAMSCHCSISHWGNLPGLRSPPRKKKWLKNSLEVAIFAKILQLIRVVSSLLLSILLQKWWCFTRAWRCGVVGTMAEAGCALGSQCQVWVLQGRAAKDPPWCSQQGEGGWQRNQPQVTQGHHDGAAQPLRSPAPIP